MVFTRNINTFNCKLCKAYEHLPLESPQLDKIENDLEANYQSMKVLNAKGRDLQAFSDQCIPAMEKKLTQIEEQVSFIR